MNTTRLLSTMCVCFSLCTSLTTNAAVITAFAEVTTDSSGTLTDAPAPQTSGQLYAVESVSVGVFPEIAVAEAFADTSGIVDARVSGIALEGLQVQGLGSTWDSHAIASWEDTFTNPTSSPKLWVFDFLIHPGSLDLEGQIGASIVNSLNVDISVDGASLFASSTVITPGSINETGTSLNGLFSTSLPNQSTGSIQNTLYHWGLILDSVDFLIPAFETVTLKYTVDASSHGSVADFATECKDFGGGGSACSAGILFADPFTSVVVDVAPAAVPVPGAAWLFSSGLIGLIVIAKRRNQVNT